MTEATASTGRVLVAFKWREDGTPLGTLYTYDAREPVSVGDQVVVPPSWWSAVPRTAVVAQLGSDYAGPVVRIVRVALRAVDR